MSGGRRGRTRAYWLLGAGAGTLAVVWLAPLERFVPGPFSAYMTMHMGVVAVAAPLLALGVAGRRADPVRRAPALFAPVPAAAVELLVVWSWHAPALHQAARTTSWALALEQGMFLLSGLLVWLAAFGGYVRRRAERRAAGVVALLLTSMHMTLLGALLALPPRPLYTGGAPGATARGATETAGAAAGGEAAAGEAAAATAWGGAAGAAGQLTPLEDQHLGGAIMLAVGGAVYLAGGLVLTLELVRDRRGSAHGVGREGAAPPPFPSEGARGVTADRPSTTADVRP